MLCKFLNNKSIVIENKKKIQDRIVFNVNIKYFDELWNSSFFIISFNI
jgi:hypothetical protein